MTQFSERETTFFLALNFASDAEESDFGFCDHYQIKRLPDGRTVFECECGKTIASTRQEAGRTVLAVHLFSQKRQRPAFEFQPHLLHGLCPDVRCRREHLLNSLHINEAMGFVGEPPDDLSDIKVPDGIEERRIMEADYIARFIRFTNGEPAWLTKFKETQQNGS